MIAIRVCPTCKRKFEARVGEPQTYCEECLELKTMSDSSVCSWFFDDDDFDDDFDISEAGKEEKAMGYKHMTFKEAAKLAKEAQVKEMWLTHYSPSLIRPEEFMDDVQKIFPNSFPGKDGKTVELDFEEE